MIPFEFTLEFLAAHGMIKLGTTLASRTDPMMRKFSLLADDAILWQQDDSAGSITMTGFFSCFMYFSPPFRTFAFRQTILAFLTFCILTRTAAKNRQTEKKINRKLVNLNSLFFKFGSERIFHLFTEKNCLPEREFGLIFF